MATNTAARLSSEDSQLWAKGYLIVPQLLTAASAARLSKYVLSVAGKTFQSDPQVPGAPARYGDCVLDSLLQTVLPRIERVANRALYPTYSYCRVYSNGDSLARHTDRAACEVSASISLQCEGAPYWPLCVQGLQSTVAAELAVGDALVYLGARCAHWREPFMGTKAVQVFLHYVTQNGPASDWKFDKRTALSTCSDHGTVVPVQHI
jgi:hypothetical protein